MSENENIEDEYDLKKSAKLIGHLYPVIKSPDGEIIAGRHRLEADPNWPVEVREDLDTPLKKALARLTENIHRRYVPAEEKTESLSIIAKELLGEGFKGDMVKEIAKRVSMSVRWVQKYLPEEYKQMDMDIKPKKKPTEDIDELIKISLREGLSYRQIMTAYGCGAGKVRRLKKIVDAETARQEAVEPIVAVGTEGYRKATKKLAETLVVDEEQEILGPKKTIVAEDLTPDPEPDPKEDATMMDLAESLKNFRENYSEIDSPTPKAQGIAGWVNRFLEADLFKDYEKRWNLT